VVNGEAITQEDLDRAGPAPGGHALAEGPLLEKFVEETLLRQEARRRGIETSFAFQRAVEEWRRDTAPNLLAVQHLRLLFPEGARAGSFDEFFPGWRERYFSLDEKKRADVDRDVGELLSRLRRRGSYELKTDVLEKYAFLAGVAPDTARQVAVATTPWGEITLAEVLAKEPSSLAHVAQDLTAVLKMWEQIIAEIAAREAIYREAEKEGLFAASSVRDLERVNRRRLLKMIFLAEYYVRAISPEKVEAAVSGQIGPWTKRFGLELEMLKTKAKTRLQANKLFHKWQEQQDLPSELSEAAGTLTRLPLDAGWKEIGEELRNILISQQWGKILPPFRVEGQFVIARINARERVPDGGSSLAFLAHNLLQAEAYEGLIAELRKSATIEMP
jgi:hypothetical protein